MIQNHGSNAQRISVFDAYSGKTHTRVVHPRDSVTFVSQLHKSFGWYDLTIRA